jgi:HemY protein
MLRILFFLVFVFAIGLGFAWLADRPGDLVITFGGYQYQVTLMVAAVAVTAIVAATMLTWWLIKAIWYSPYTISRYFRVRRRDRGYQALSTGMIAAGAGDAGLARKKKKEAMKLISADQEPLFHLLDAQASLLEGDHEGARAKFEAMLADPETRLLGLRGLYLEAERLGDRTASRHYAAKATETAPQLAWAADATLEQKAEEHQWDEALRLVEAQKSTRQVDREAANRRRAVLLTAKAMDMLAADPAAAKSAAVEANRLAPDLVPAAVTAAKALFRQNDLRKGAKILEASWKISPHPELAEAYLSARPGDSTHDRLTRAKKLQTLRGNNVESSLAVARAALDAGEFAVARRETEAAVRLGARESVYLLLADIEEAETGDQGKVRQWLGMAVRAPRDPAWVADGYVAERWSPVSPMSGRLDAFEWRSPAERLGQLLESADSPDPLPAAAALPAAVSSAPVEAIAPGAPTGASNVVAAEPAIANAEPAVVNEEERPKPEQMVHPERPLQQGPAAVTPAPLMDAPAPRPRRDTQEVAVRLPDDPGVDPDDEKPEESRFRLF